VKELHEKSRELFGYQMNHKRIVNFINRVFIGPTLRYLFRVLGLASKYRFLNTNATAIGHLCLDVDCFLKEKSIKEYPFCGVLLADRTRVANRVVSKLWAENLGIILIENPLMCYLLDYLRIYAETSFDCSRFTAIHGQPSDIYKIYNNYKGSEPVIAWETSLYTEAKFLFERLFPDVDVQRVVVLHSRDSTYDKKILNHNAFTQKHRNSDIGSYSSILKYLEMKGYVVIRIGDYEKDESISGINYLELEGASQYEKEMMNVYIPSICSLFLGSASGAMSLAQVWRRPVFAINVMPYSAVKLITAESMTIPKLLSSNGRILSASEIFKKNYHLYRKDWEFENSKIEVISNEAPDCLDDFIEFFDAFVKKDEKIQLELKNSLQQTKYNELCPLNSYDYYGRSLIPRHFFEKYQIV